jgi:hypothetical protein
MKALRLPTHVSAVTYLFRSRSPRVPPAFVLRCCAPERSEGPFRPGPWLCRLPHAPACSRVDANGISQVFRRSIPCLCSVPGPRSSRRVLATDGHVDAAPAMRTTKASALADFEANPQLRHLLPYASRVALPHTCKACFRPAGSPLPGGSRTLWTATKGFSSFDDHPPFLLS